MDTVANVVYCGGWPSYFAAVRDGDYEKAFQNLEEVWQGAWEAYSRSEFPSISERQALAFTVLCKAYLSFKSEIHEATITELLHVNDILHWKEGEDVWSQMNMQLLTFDPSWQSLSQFCPIKSPQVPIYRIAMPVFLLYVWVSIEIIVAKKNYLAAAQKYLLLRRYLMAFHSVRSALNQAERGWTSKAVLENIADSCLIRVLETFVMDRHVEVAWNFLVEYMPTIPSPAIELMRVKIALMVNLFNGIMPTKTGRHETAVATLHLLCQRDSLCSIVARGFLSEAVGSGEAFDCFESSATILISEITRSASIARAALSNNAAVCYMCEESGNLSVNCSHRGKFVESYVTLLSSLASFLPLSIIYEAGKAPMLIRTPGGIVQGRYVPLYLTFRNSLTINELVPHTNLRNQIIRDLVIAKGIKDREILIMGLNKVPDPSF